jgi:hypothetical protein
VVSWAPPRPSARELLRGVGRGRGWGAISAIEVVALLFSLLTQQVRQ